MLQQLKNCTTCAAGETGRVRAFPDRLSARVLGLEVIFLKPFLPADRFVVTIQLDLAPLGASIFQVNVPVVVQFFDFASEFFQRISDSLSFGDIVNVFPLPILQAVADDFVGRGGTAGDQRKCTSEGK